MKIETRKITPDEARSILENAAPNKRPVTNKRVNLYADQMREGKWELTHQGIAIDNDGHLVDGRHRLMAVINANTPIEFMIVTGDINFAKVDVGKNRTAGDILTIAGWANATTLGASLRLVACYDSGPRPWSSARHRVTGADLEALAEKHGERMMRFMAPGHRIADRIGNGSRSTYTAALYVCDRWALSKGNAYASEFSDWSVGLQTGVNIPEKDGRLALASWANNGARRVGQTIRQELLFGCMIRAYSSFVTDQPWGMVNIRDVSTWSPRLPD